MTCSAFLKRELYPPVRLAIPFEVSSYQRNVGIFPPCFQRSTRACYPHTSKFREFYIESRLPIAVQHLFRGYSILWLADPHRLDYSYYLPIFANGLCEERFPICVLAKEGFRELCMHGKGKIVPCLKQIVDGFINAFRCRTFNSLRNTLECIQAMLLSDPTVGPALIQYYKKLLVIPNIFIRNKGCGNLGDTIDHKWDRREVMYDIINRTLNYMEITGGPNAFLHIKHTVPTYQSCSHNSVCGSTLKDRTFVF